MNMCILISLHMPQNLTDRKLSHSAEIALLSFPIQVQLEPQSMQHRLPTHRMPPRPGLVRCHGLIRRMGMALAGRRSKLCSLHGPMNHENVNGTHPAMITAQRYNSDVQLPYRLPPLCEARLSIPVIWDTPTLHLSTASSICYYDFAYYQIYLNAKKVRRFIQVMATNH